MRPPLISVFVDWSFLNRRHAGMPQTLGMEDIQSKYNIAVLVGYQVHRLGAGGRPDTRKCKKRLIGYLHRG